MAIGVQAQAIGVKLEAVGAEWKNKAMSLGDAGALIQLVGTEIKTGGLRVGIQALKILL
jgi:type VI secretion system secreted protein VgrG